MGLCRDRLWAIGYYAAKLQVFGGPSQTSWASRGSIAQITANAPIELRTFGEPPDLAETKGKI